MPKDEKAEVGAADEGKQAAVGQRDPEFARAIMEESGGFVPETEKPPAEPAPESEAKPEPEAAAEEKAAKDEEGKDEEGKDHSLPPEVQEKVDRRIGKEVARRKEAEELLEAERTLSKELTAKVSDLETKGREGPAGSGTENRLLLADSEAELEKREDFLWRVEEFCEENRDGYEGKGTDQDPSYTAEEIRTRLLQVRRERERDLPRAREMLKRRAAFEAVTREAYPELADPRSDLSAEANRVLARVPGLKALPDYKLVLGDLLAGRKAREVKKTGPARVAPKPPPAPAAPTPPRSGVQGTGKPKGKSTFETFADGEFSEEALAKGFD